MPAETTEPQLSERFDRALEFTSRLHRRQLRKGTTVPYVSHLLAVAGIALEHGADEDTAIAALLHDAVEDQGGAKTLEHIRQRFGDRVAGIVAACSDTDRTPKPPWRVRKEAYLEHLAVERDHAVLLVSASDKLHNARTILVDALSLGDATWRRFAGGKEGSLWYYRSVVRTLRANAAAQRFPHLVDELDRVVSHLVAVANGASAGDGQASSSPA
ncbi:MAG: phosphohydrolase [Deltaproteobacteria bacterium HGW-Deltaproteobacteria-14]|jgi:GTP pyrophosphokinase|nr:MAG: phosphohydrolase [Deltaproteobacteria bacterium HGW-Deltaproteobacteria-14]